MEAFRYLEPTPSSHNVDEAQQVLNVDDLARCRIDSNRQGKSENINNLPSELFLNENLLIGMNNLKEIFLCVRRVHKVAARWRFETLVSPIKSQWVTSFTNKYNIQLSQ